MKTTRKTNSNCKRFCIFITKEEYSDSTIKIKIDEVGDEELKTELKEQLLREILEEYNQN